VSLIDDESVLWNLRISEVISSKKEDDLGLSAHIRSCFGDNSEFEGIHSSNIVMKNVESIPVLLWIDEV